jgi:hypothetical protein
MTAGVARLTSVVVSGFLSNPAEKYGIFEAEFFCHFPYLLPCLVNACIGVIALICKNVCVVYVVCLSVI